MREGAAFKPPGQPYGDFILFCKSRWFEKTVQVSLDSSSETESEGRSASRSALALFNQHLHLATLEDPSLAGPKFIISSVYCIQLLKMDPADVGQLFVLSS